MSTLSIVSRPTRKTRNKHGGHKPSVAERLLAAMERLLEQGQRFGSISVEQLSTEAGMSRGTFYLHFRDKNELVTHLVGIVTDEIVESAGTWLAARDDGQRPLREDMQATMRGVSETFKKHRAILAAFYDTARYDAESAALFDKMMTTISDRCHHSIIAVKGGRGSHRSTQNIAHALSWFVVLYLGRFSPQRTGKELEQMTKAVAHICESAIFSDRLP